MSCCRGSLPAGGVGSSSSSCCCCRRRRGHVLVMVVRPRQLLLIVVLIIIMMTMTIIDAQQAHAQQPHETHPLQQPQEPAQRKKPLSSGSKIKQRLQEFRRGTFQYAKEHLTDDAVLQHDARQRAWLQEELVFHIQRLQDHFSGRRSLLPLSLTASATDNESNMMNAAGVVYHVQRQVDWYQRHLEQLETESMQEKRDRYLDLMESLHEMSDMSDLDFDRTGLP